MLTFYAHKGLVEDPYPTFPGRLIRATREQIGRGGMPTPRRYGIVMGWLDPTTMTPLTAACNDDRLLHAISETRATDIENWHRPEVLAPLFAQSGIAS